MRQLLLPLTVLLIGLAIGQSAGGFRTAATSSSVDVFVSSFGDEVSTIYRVRIQGETVDMEFVATLDFPAEDMVVDSEGILYIGGVTTGVKRIDTSTNTVLTDVGTNICGPEGLSIDDSGNVYANTRQDPCDHSGVWRIDGGIADTAVQVMPAFTSWGEGTAFLTHDPYPGHLIAAAADASLFGDEIVRSSPEDLANNNSPTTFIGGLFDLSIPVGLAVNSAGEVFVADAGHDLIKRYAADGAFLGNFTSGLSGVRFIEFDGADNLYVAAGAETENGKLLKFAPDGTSTLLENIPEIVGVAVAPSEPEPAEPPRRVVLFIQGIASESNCDLTGFVSRVEWMRRYLDGTDPLGRWVAPAAGIPAGENFDFAYYGYWSERDQDPYCSTDRSVPEYEGPNTCWSLDGADREGGPLTGQGEKLAAYLRDVIAQNANVKIDIIVHSQGAALSIYTALSQLDRDDELSKINSIVTLDGVVAGISSLAPALLSLAAGCPRVPTALLPDPVDPDYDSPYDMVPMSAVMRCNVLDACSPAALALYTVDAVPGYVGCLDPLSILCLQIPAVSTTSTVPWALSHIKVGSITHGDIWDGDTALRGISLPGRELVRLKQFMGCAVARGLGRCADFANGDSQAVPQFDTAMSIHVVRPGSERITVVSQWDGSTVTMSLISPSGRVIDASTIALDVLHRSGDTFEFFEINNPEPGDWTVELFGADVPPEGEEVLLTFVAVPDPSVDADGDQVFDDEDNCPGVVNGSQLDTDGDGLGDACDDDNDNDGVLNSVDNCEFVPNPAQEDVNANGIGDACDPDLNDLDEDGVLDGVDNCPLDPNPDQSDVDGDGFGDACDPDFVPPTPTQTPTPTPTPPLTKDVGDVNSDGQVNAIDAALVLQQQAGLIGSVPNPGSADVNEDGMVNAIDAALILQYDAGLLDSLPA